jgi:RNA polymerase sigma factor (sigma-70 family)
MDLSQGFGEPTEAEVYEAELVAKHYNTARSLAFQMKIPSDSADFDDLVQEGAVAAWQATSSIERTDPVTYGMVVAKRRIQGHLRGKHPMLGSEREGGRIHDQFRKVENREPVESIEDKAYDRDIFNEIERRIDMDRAIGHLTTRDQTIVTCVSAGMGWTEIAPVVDMTSNAIQKRWRKVLRPALAERLAIVRAAS